jgi:hypothetical protein
MGTIRIMQSFLEHEDESRQPKSQGKRGLHELERRRFLSDS